MRADGEVDDRRWDGAGWVDGCEDVVWGGGVLVSGWGGLRGGRFELN